MHDAIVRVWGYNAGNKADPGFILLVQSDLRDYNCLEQNHFLGDVQGYSSAVTYIFTRDFPEFAKSLHFLPHINFQNCAIA